MPTPVPIALFAAVALSTPALAAAEPAAPYGATWAIAPDAAFSPYSDAGGDKSSGVMRGLALGAHGARRWGRWGAGLGVEGTLWRTDDAGGRDDWLAALHVGVEGEVLSGGGRVRSRLGGGLAVLLEGTELDGAGATGFYIDLRPAGVRWAVGETVIGLDPLTLFMTLPDAGGIPLVDVQYRFCVSVEFGR